MYSGFALLLVVTCFFIKPNPASRIPTLDQLTTKVVGQESITCNQAPLIVKRTTIVEFIQSFCLEIIGEEFGNQSNPGVKEIYTIRPPPINPKEATHVVLELRSVKGCRFSVDDSCGRYLTRPTDECNIGEEEKQGGMVTDGCSIWTAKPI
ncbi:hypothetical protein DFH28DRAFT_981554 [Melampsora americana]|nr:hypothetical protein DFH28DRAFT_981554 [Melampsora americana]